MPEYPDVEYYAEILRETIVGARLDALKIDHPFLLRTVEPPVAEFPGGTVTDVSTVAKRIAIAFDRDLFAAVHLMIAGRLQWKPGEAVSPSRAKGGRGKATLARLVFDRGTLSLTEAGTKRRAALHLLRGRESLDALHPGGADPFTLDGDSFLAILHERNRTLKRALTDQRILIGIGNAYSDEILWAARMSPLSKTYSLEREDAERLLAAVTSTLTEWRARLRERWNGKWPKKVTAFVPGMAVHGRYGEACPRCGAPVQRIRYAENEANYCATCQTGGTIYKDRALSRLLKDEWPRSIEELEERRATAPPPRDDGATRG